MPKVKKNCKYTKTYDEEELGKAIEAINNGMPKKQAAEKFKIPRQTLQYRLSEKFKKPTHGPATYLTTQEENLLEQWILESHRKGFPRRRDDIQASVKSFLEANPRIHPFKNNVPGKHWYTSFLKRHPNLALRVPEAVTNASSCVSEADIKKWFNNIETYLREKNYFDILSDPNRVFNGDETCFLLCPKESKVLAPKGARNVYEVDQGTAKTSLTVMFTFSASGAITPPMVVFPYKRLPAVIAKSVPDEWGIGTSDNGWMKCEVFYEYISNIFNKYITKMNVQKPVILFVDGHRTHMTYELSKLCTSLDIILIALYPNATRILQPADVSCFKPLKNSWKRAVLEWRRNNPTIELTKQYFAPILQKAIKSLSCSTISNGFKACGLYPWSSDALDYSKCLGHNQNKQIIHIPQDSQTLQYDEFCEIIGPQKLAELQSYNENNADENFQLLVKIFTKLEPTQINVEQVTLKETDPTLVVDEVEWTDIPIIFDNASPKTSCNENDIIAPENEILFDISTCTRDESDHNGSLQDYLVWPKTPERKGKRQTERLPFVITSSTWKKIHEDKEKRAAEVKRKKEEKQEVKRRQEEKKILTKPKHVRNIVCREKNATNTDDRSRMFNANIVSETLSTPFSKDINENEIESEGMSLSLPTLSLPTKNKIMNKGLCFMCTQSFSLSSFGIRCQNCRRAYHSKCLQKTNSLKDYFLCKICEVSTT